jgi:hypothetical protein
MAKKAAKFSSCMVMIHVQLLGTLMRARIINREYLKTNCASVTLIYATTLNLFKGYAISPKNGAPSVC